MKTVNTDVLVVGAGPAGLTAAAFLARSGVDVLAVAKYAGSAHTPRAHITNQRTVEVFRNLGIEDRVRELALPRDKMGANVWATTFAGLELARVESWGAGTARRADYDAASPCRMCNAPQHQLEPVLLDAARGHGARVRFRSELLDITQDDTGVSAIVLDRNSEEEYVVRAQYAIGADGANSTVTQTLGFPMEGESGIAHALTVWLDADLSKFMAHRSGALFWVAPPGTDVWLSPWTMISPTEWVALFLGDSEAPLAPTDEAVAELIRASIGDDDVEFVVKHIGRWRMNHVVAGQYRQGRVFLVGDAAHRHPPANGLGSNTSIQDSANLAWKLTHVLRGLAGPGLLDTYDAERQPVGRQVIDRAIQSIAELQPLTDALGMRPGQSSDERWEALRGLYEPTPEAAQRRADLLAALELTNYQFNAHGVELGQRYTSAAVVPDGSNWPEPERDPQLYYQATTHPGAHLPHAWLQHGTERVSTLDLAAHDGFTLVTGVAGEAWLDAARKVAAASGVRVDAHAVGLRAEYDDVLGDWTRLRGFADDGCVLVRPDRHIAFRASQLTDQPEHTLREALAAVLDRPIP